jgi:AbrB family looped-hinge helix DNA binding protein
MGGAAMEMAKVTSKGQITIPISIRKRLKISEGDKLLFIDRPDGVMMVNPDLLGSQQETETTTGADTTTTDSSTPREKKTKKPQTTQPTVDENETYSETPSKATKPSPEKTERKSGATVGNLNLDSLLDEIRSIGRNI